MDQVIKIDERVDVLVFCRANAKFNKMIIPFRMKWRGREITFTKLGMRHSTMKGKRMVHIFEITDGTDDYRLAFDAEKLTWVLELVLPGGSR